MRVLIDGDIVAYRVAWTVEDEIAFGIPRWRCDEMMDNILDFTNAEEYNVYLSGSEEDNFRYKIYPRYKESRKTKPKPKWLEQLKEHLIVEWGARIACGMEADDALGINQTNDTVIASIDKDLLQIPGNHWNIVKKEWTNVSEFEGLKSFYRQILTGDRGDDIPGIDGIGPVKSQRAVSRADSEGELLEACLRLYRLCFKGLSEQAIRDLIQRNGSLLKIKRTEDEGIWECPFHLLKPTEVLTPSSTPQQPEVGNLSTEPIMPETETGTQQRGGQTEDHGVS